MKLLLDQNLSDRLVEQLQLVYPGTTHVRRLGLERADDSAIWQCAIAGDFVIVSKDADFHQRAFASGPPPKVVWIRRGNCSSCAIASILQEGVDVIASFCDDPRAAFLALA